MATVAAACVLLALPSRLQGGTQPVADERAIGVTLAARSLTPGELVVVTLSVDDLASDVRVEVFGRTTSAVRTAGVGWQALVGIDVEQTPGSYTLKAVAQKGPLVLNGQRELIVLPRQFATRTLRVDPSFVNPPALLLQRIEAEAALLDAIYGGVSAGALWDMPFIRPVPHRANSRFGTRSVFNGEPRAPHGGTDFLSPSGTPVKAPNAGRVVLARELFFTGNTVIIDHGFGVFSMLAHLSRIEVVEGESIARGRITGLVGATGRVTGAHLHWSLRVAGARVDPLSALALLGSDAARGPKPPGS